MPRGVLDPIKFQNNKISTVMDKKEKGKKNKKIKHLHRVVYSFKCISLNYKT